MAKRKLFVFDDPSYTKPFESVFDVHHQTNMKGFDGEFYKCDAVLFTGGADVSPFLYAEQKHVTTRTDPERDKFEQMIFLKAALKGIPILGICRGAQFACVMNNGKLFQDVSGHTQAHEIEDVHGNKMKMPSTHHQMMRHSLADDPVLIAWASPAQSMWYKTGENYSAYNPKSYIEPEIVYFKKTKALAIQGHPEYSSDPLLHKYCCDLVRRYMFEEDVTPKYGEDAIVY